MAFRGKRCDHRLDGQLYIAVYLFMQGFRDVSRPYGYLVACGARQPLIPLARADDVEENPVRDLCGGGV
jgi:hypothetical protein